MCTGENLCPTLKRHVFHPIDHPHRHHPTLHNFLLGSPGSTTKKSDVTILSWLSSKRIRYYSSIQSRVGGRQQGDDRRHSTGRRTASKRVVRPFVSSASCFLLRLVLGHFFLVSLGCSCSIIHTAWETGHCFDLREHRDDSERCMNLLTRPRGDLVSAGCRPPTRLQLQGAQGPDMSTMP